MPEILHRVRRRLVGLAWFHAAMVLAGGSLAVMVVAVLLADLSLVVAAWAPSPTWVLPWAEALLSFVAALVAIYLVALPLYRTFPLPRFVGMLERRLGRETYLLTSCELLRAGGDAGPRGLVERVGSEAWEDLEKLSPGKFASAERVFRLLVLFCILCSASLVAAMVYPDHVKVAVTRLVSQEKVRSSHKGEEPLAARDGPAAREAAPPCREVSVTVTPPEYLEGMPVQVQWGTELKVLPGTEVTVVCRGGGEVPALELHTVRGVLRSEFQPGAAGGAEDVAASVSVLEPCELRISGSSGTVQTGSMAFGTVEDRAPECNIVQPAGRVALSPAGTVAVLAEVRDDTGIESVELRFQVKGLDEVAAVMELARPEGRTQVLVQRDIPVAAFGADPGDEILLSIEGVDVNTVSGPSTCASATWEVAVISQEARQEEVIERLSQLRDGAVDLSGEVLGTAWEGAQPPSLEALRLKLERYSKTLAELSGRMGSLGMFKQEDTRRVAMLGADLDEAVSVDPEAWSEARKARDLVQASGREIEQHAVVLDGVVEKLAGEYLFLLSGRIQGELSRLHSIVREASGEAVASRSVFRSARKVQRTAERAARFKSSVQPSMPSLFSQKGGTTEADWFSRIAVLTRALAVEGVSEGALPASWLSRLEELSEAVERAAQSVEGEYAQSMTRLSSSFRNAQSEVSRRLRKSLELNVSIRKQLEALMVEVEAESLSYVKKRRALDSVREAARTARKLSELAKTFRPKLYLEVDRTQIVEFREKLTRLQDRLAVLEVEEASSLAGELEALTQSMEFSMKLMIRYGDEQVNMDKCERELARVKEGRRMAESLASRLDSLKPERKKLFSLRTNRLEQMLVQLDALALELAQLRDKVTALEKMFPMFFGQIAPQVERLGENVAQVRLRLSELMLEDAQKLSAYMDETFQKLLDLMENAVRNARSANALGPGGAQPSLDIGGKGEAVPLDRLEKYMEFGATLGEKGEWSRVVDGYYSLLLP